MFETSEWLGGTLGNGYEGYQGMAPNRNLIFNWIYWFKMNRRATYVDVSSLLEYV